MAALVDETDRAIRSIQEAENQLIRMGEDFTGLCQHNLDGKMKEMKAELKSILGPAATYKHHVLPQSIMTMTIMKDVLEMYMELGFEHWKESLELLLEDAHKGYMTVLKQKKVYASLMSVLQEKTRELDHKSVALHVDASCKESVTETFCKDAIVCGKIAAAAGGAAFATTVVNPVLWVGVAACAVSVAAGAEGGSLAYSSIECEREAQKMRAEGQAKADLSKRIDQGFSQRLKEFGVTLNALGVLFHNLYTEVSGLQDCSHSADNDAAKAHYERYKLKASILHMTCSKFIAAVPMMKSQLQGIPSDSKVEQLCIEYFGKIDGYDDHAPVNQSQSVHSALPPDWNVIGSSTGDECYKNRGTGEASCQPPLKKAREIQVSCVPGSGRVETLRKALSSARNAHA